MKAILRVGRSSAPVGVALALALGLLAAPATAAPLSFAEGSGNQGGQRAHGAGQVFSPRGMAVDNSCALHSPPLDESTSPTARNSTPATATSTSPTSTTGASTASTPKGSFELAWGAGVADGKSEALQRCGPAAGNLTSRCFRRPEREPHWPRRPAAPRRRGRPQQRRRLRQRRLQPAGEQVHRLGGIHLHGRQGGGPGRRLTEQPGGHLHGRIPRERRRLRQGRKRRRPGRILRRCQHRRHRSVPPRGRLRREPVGRRRPADRRPRPLRSLPLRSGAARRAARYRTSRWTPPPIASTRSSRPSTRARKSPSRASPRATASRSATCPSPALPPAPHRSNTSQPWRRSSKTSAWR